jgi:hypothetical protein
MGSLIYNINYGSSAPNDSREQSSIYSKYICRGCAVVPRYPVDLKRGYHKEYKNQKKNNDSNMLFRENTKKEPRYFQKPSAVNFGKATISPETAKYRMPAAGTKPPTTIMK